MVDIDLLYIDFVDAVTSSPKTDISAPAQKPRPAPVITTARIDSSTSHFLREFEIPSTKS